jgi:hypothetical protein
VKTKGEKDREKKTEKKEKIVDDDDLEGEWQKITHKDDPSKPLFDPKVEITVNVSIRRISSVNFEV